MDCDHRIEFQIGFRDLLPGVHIASKLVIYVEKVSLILEGKVEMME